MNIANWTVTVGIPTTDSNNKVNVDVTYAYNDGTNQYSFPDTYSGVLSNDDLIQLIQVNLQAHDQTVQGLLNVPNLVSGQLDLTQIFPQPATPFTPTLAVKAITAAPAQTLTPS
jgi:hypothetical protein